MKVITYQLADFSSRHVSACGDCLRGERGRMDAPDWMLPRLGPVSHGLHDGECDNCEALYRRDVSSLHRANAGEDE